MWRATVACATGRNKLRVTAPKVRAAARIATSPHCLGDDDIPPQKEVDVKAIVVTDQAAGTAGMKLVERPEPRPAINDVIVQVHASGFVGTELAWPRPGPIAST